MFDKTADKFVHLHLFTLPKSIMKSNYFNIIQVCYLGRLCMMIICFLFQSGDGAELTAKPKRSFYAARDLYKYRHQYPVRTFYGLKLPFQ